MIAEAALRLPRSLDLGAGLFELERGIMDERRTRFAAVGATLPAAMLAWRAGNLLVAQARGNPAARRWARIGTIAAGLAGVTAVLAAIAGTMRSTRRNQGRLDGRLDAELEDSFPASDAPAVTRSRPDS